MRQHCLHITFPVYVIDILISLWANTLSLNEIIVISDGCVDDQDGDTLKEFVDVIPVQRSFPARLKLFAILVNLVLNVKAKIDQSVHRLFPIRQDPGMNQDIAYNMGILRRLNLRLNIEIRSGNSFKKCVKAGFQPVSRPSANAWAGSSPM